ncbi:MAG: hypothetical protein LAN71_15200 [Acidobacteriia bacterium]|nr:hypothetical protein [Terriglobia bacterium]
MKIRFLTGAAMVLLAAGSMLAAETAMTGYISDSKCGAKGANEGAAECTVKCVKGGAKYVFVNDGDQKVYAIDAQDKVAGHAGHHVTVKGTVEGDSIKLTSIDMAAAPAAAKEIKAREAGSGLATGKAANKPADKP